MSGAVTTAEVVIPFTQDHVATAQLTQVAVAEDTFALMNDANGFAFGSPADLATAGLLDDAAPVAIGTTVNREYVAVAKSETGKFFYITDSQNTPQEIAGLVENSDYEAVKAVFADDIQWVENETFHNPEATVLDEDLMKDNGGTEILEAIAAG